MLTTLLTIVYAVLIFSVIIFVHEFGHYIFAKIFDVYVIEFSIGMGPTLFKKQIGETLYSVRAIPMGGFCQLEGENGESENPRSFGKKGKLKRFIILAAGSFMNLILGFLVVFIMNISANNDYYIAPVIDEVYANTPAYTEGLLKGDRIIKINGNKVNFYSDYAMYDNKEEKEITVLRNGEKINFKLTPKSYLMDKEGNIIKESTEEGSVKLIGIKFGTEEKTFLTTVKNSYFESLLIGKMIFISIKDIISGVVSADNLSGPVGIVNEINTAAKKGIDYILYIMALITINLGIFNLLPLPALDGGRITFIIIEAIIGKPVPAKYEGIVHAIGFILLILLMIYATGNDFIRIFKG